MKGLRLDLEKSGISSEEIAKYNKKVLEIHNEFQKKKDDESEFLGWLELPTNYDKREFEKVKRVAKKIQKNSEVLVVIGIGGSYLGARAVIESLTNTFNNIFFNKFK